MRLLLRKLHHIPLQLPHLLHPNRIITTNPRPAHTPMPLNSRQPLLLRPLEELLLQILPILALCEAETHIHARADSLVRHDRAVDMRILIDDAVDGRRFLVSGGGDGGDAAIRAEEGEDLGGDVDVEDGEGVVEAVVCG